VGRDGACDHRTAEHLVIGVSGYAPTVRLPDCPEVDSDDDSAIGAARVLARLARTLEVVLAEMPLSVAQYRMLSLLSERSVSASAAAQFLAVSQPNVSLLLNGMVRRGLVLREQDPTDARRFPLRISPTGARLLKRADRELAKQLRATMARVLDDPQEADDVLAMMGWFKAGLDRVRNAGLQQVGQDPGAVAS
jgi:DNA-binding MarR family transcriptional regulator